MSSPGYGIPMNTTYSNDNSLEKSFGKIAKSTFDIARQNNTPSISPTSTQQPGQVDMSNSGMASNIPKYVSGPTSLKSLPITTNYGGITKYETYHPALDLAAPIGTPIPSLSSGIVKNVVSGYKQGDKGYGNFIIVEDENGNQFRYSHLKQSYVPIGQKINRGDILGEMGNTGSTYSLTKKKSDPNYGSHLDLRIFNTAKKMYINPLSYL